LTGGKTGKYCADEGNGVVCNRDKALGWEKFTIEKHGNKFSLKGGKTGKYCADEGNRIICNRDKALGWEKFMISPF